MPNIFGALLKKWAPGAGGDGAPNTAVCLMRTAIDLAVRARAEIGQAPRNILHTLAGHHTEGLNQLTLLAVNRDSLIYLLHSLFVDMGGK